MRKALVVLLTCVVVAIGALIAKGFMRPVPPPSVASVADQVREGFRTVSYTHLTLPTILRV